MAKQQHHIIVGITGGIGSGKTTISKYFETLGIPVYHADSEAKSLMNRSKVIKRKLIALFGDKAYLDDKINRPFLSHNIFNDQSLLHKMNAIIHPKVASHFKRWLKKQDAPYILKEVAIIFENSQQDQFDAIITVVADEKERINRVMNRDNRSKESVMSIIANQLSDEEKIKKSNFVIYNNDLEVAKNRALEIHNVLISKYN